MLESSIRTTPSAPTDRCGVQMRRVSSVALPIRPLRLSIITKETPLKRIVRSDAVVFLAATPLLAQQPPQPTELPKLVENIDVRVINVDVVVTDKKGKPVTGLTKEDFELYENRVPKTISNFYEVEGSKALNAVVTTEAGKPLPTPVVQQAKEEIPDTLRRRIIFFIDNLSLMPFNRSMKVRVSFTRDPILIAQTLDIIAGESALGVSNKSEARDVRKRIEDAQ